MAKFSKKVGGKEVGQAEVYAEPHQMTGAAGVDLSNNGYGPAPQRNTANEVNMSVGNISRNAAPGEKVSGIETRGNGAATKGRMARGPMA